MTAHVNAPLLVTRCHGCYRRRACAFVHVLSGWKHPMCRQCLRGLMPRITAALTRWANKGE